MAISLVIIGLTVGDFRSLSVLDIGCWDAGALMNSAKLEIFETILSFHNFGIFETFPADLRCTILPIIVPFILLR